MKCLVALIFLWVQIQGPQARAESPGTPPLTLAQAKRQIQEQYPDSQIKVVTPDELEKYRAQAQPPPPPQWSRASECGRDSSAYILTPEGSAQATATVLSERNTRYSDTSGEWGTYNSGFGGFDDKGVLVVLAVVGVVVVGILFIYSISYIYKAAKAGLNCKSHDEIGLRLTYFEDQNFNQFRVGRMHGAYYSLGYDVSFGKLGLTLEAGHHSLDLRVNQIAKHHRFEGAYFMIGPSFGFPFTPRGDAISLELLAGTSSHHDVGLVSNLKLGLDLVASEKLRLGGYIGASLMDVRGFDGYLSDVDDLSFLFGLQAGLRF